MLETWKVLKFKLFKTAFLCDIFQLKTSYYVSCMPINHYTIINPTKVSNSGWRFPAYSVYSVRKVIWCKLNFNLTPFYFDEFRLKLAIIIGYFFRHLIILFNTLILLYSFIRISLTLQVSYQPGIWISYSKTLITPYLAGPENQLSQ